MIDTLVFFIGLLFILIVPTLLAIIICTAIGYYLLAVLHIYTGRTLFTTRIRKYAAFVLGIPVAYLIPTIHEYNPSAFLITVCFLLALGIYGMLRKHLTFGELDTYVRGKSPNYLSSLDDSPVRGRSKIRPKPLKSAHVFNPYGDEDEDVGVSEGASFEGPFSESSPASGPSSEPGPAPESGGILGMFGFGQATESPAASPDESTYGGSILDTVDNIGEVDLKGAERLARKYLEIHAQVPRAIKPRDSKKTGTGFYFEFRTDKLYKVTLDKQGNVTDWTKE